MQQMSAQHALRPDPLPPAGTVFAALPAPREGRDTDSRKVGVEIEFGGLPAEQAARVVVSVLGGTPEKRAPGDWRITGGDLGPITLYLDTRWRPTEDSALARSGVEFGRNFVPFEIVTEPLAQKDLPRLDHLLTDLAGEGAEGSGEGPLNGFGLHLNVELADPERGTDMPRVALSFALLERWLRRRDPLATGRRLLPFADPWPTALTSDLAGAWPGLDLEGLLAVLHRHVSSRNYGLDLLPAWAEVAPDDYRLWMENDTAVSARPTYHYRMPDCRIGAPGWSLAYEWNRWALIEAVASDDDLLTTLCRDWWQHREVPMIPEREAWFRSVTNHLGRLADLAPEGGPRANEASS
ncbi:amidoligase family protein [Tropicimonas sp. IMCC6043]|uniref:amidoligase family protein n=1 Tax=Tropicimonas sp. IMCC6043 TaxID=2510645 RepID=UPI00101CCAC1|nr:amidoligase family protein [Tropicimonas sp. IMCC6043]RYH07281.1 hypothetical protein EU800_20615 [Tropicimonas sp. IMCC6043]